jgi:hypothetical protein
MAYSARISSKAMKARVLAIFLAAGLLTGAQPAVQPSDVPGIVSEPMRSTPLGQQSAGTIRDSAIPDPRDAGSTHGVGTRKLQRADILAGSYELGGVIEAFPRLFLRPPSAASVQVGPEVQGAFAAPGQPQDYRINLLNNGDMGSDTYALTVVSAWPVSFYNADGTTALGDTDSDGIVDSGPIEQGEARTVAVRVVPPDSAAAGSSASVLVTAASSNDPSKQMTVIIQSAIPAWFAQVFRDDGNEAMSLYLAQPNAQTVIKVTPDLYDGQDPAIAETSSGFVYAWTRTGSAGSFQISEIEYTLLDRSGGTLRSVGKLVDHSRATITTYDRSPALAVAPNGRIGVLWYRSLYDAGNYNDNVYFAILDSTGQIAYGPLNLTSNAGRSPGGTPDAPLFYSPRIAATDDDRYVLAWEKHYSPTPGYPVYDIYYAVQDTLGASVQGITQFTNDTPGWDNSYEYPAVAALRGGLALLAFNRTGSGGETYFGVLSSDGSIVRGPTNLTNDGLTVRDWDYLDAVQLSDGQIIVAWTTRSDDLPQTAIRWAILDSAYNLVAGPTTLSHPSAGETDRYPSVTADSFGHAVLTWTDSGWSHLYYALLDSAGNVVTSPMIFRTPGLSRYDTRRIFTSYGGHGNTTYHYPEIYLPLVLKND